MAKPRKPGIADTLKQAASAAGVTPAAVRYARDNGCDAFNHGRVDTEKLCAWIEEHRDEIDQLQSLSKEQVQIKLGLQKLEQEAWKFEALKGKYIPITEVCQLVMLVGKQLRAELQRRLETELPPKLLGRSVAEMTETMRQTVDELCRIFHDRTTQWNNEPQAPQPSEPQK